MCKGADRGYCSSEPPNTEQRSFIRLNIRSNKAMLLGSTRWLLPQVRVGPLRQRMGWCLLLETALAAHYLILTLYGLFAVTQLGEQHLVYRA